MHTILVVDDKPGILKAISGALKEEFPQYNIITATNENEAIEIIHTKSLDIIITDLMLNEGQEGILVLNEAKKIDPLIMVIIITAYGNELNRKEAFNIGAFDCLDKNSVGSNLSEELAYKIRIAIKTRKDAKDLIEAYEKLDSFKKYFDPLVLDKIKTDPGLLKPRNKTITIVFWDIRGFSALCEILKSRPDLIADFLNEYYEIAGGVIYKNGGILDKFIGDGVMALFGAFDENEEDEDKNAISAMQAALDLKKEFHAIYLKAKKVWERAMPNKFDIGLGCGIHTGEAMVGNLGSNIRDHFTAIGPHVNLAARIESTAKSDQIRFSATTKNRIDSYYKYKLVETLTSIKNISGTFDIYEIV